MTTNNNTEPPRVRPGQAYPGGKKLRKALERLAKRREAHGGKNATVAPGSMK